MKILAILFLFISVNIFGQTKIPESFTKSILKIEDLRVDVYKSKINVKMNHADNASGYISLPVHIYKSLSETPVEPIVYMTGGPGQTNFDYIPSKDFLTDHDFIIIGYRGVDGLQTIISAG